MQSGNRMLSTINDIIEISKIETQQINPKHQTVDLNEFLNSQYAFFLPETSKIDFSLKNSLLASEYEVETDLSMLDSILTNLIKNAIKFTNKGSVEFACTKKEQFIEFYVKDTGIGISKDQQKLVFERFRQISTDSTKIIEGSGLGLSIAKAYAELLGGKIWMKSKEGVGSQFWFIIPCTR
jgi:signal transduction histidine kinase